MLLQLGVLKLNKLYLYKKPPIIKYKSICEYVPNGFIFVILLILKPFMLKNLKSKSIVCGNILNEKITIHKKIKKYLKFCILLKQLFIIG